MQKEKNQKKILNYLSSLNNDAYFLKISTKIIIKKFINSLNQWRVYSYKLVKFIIWFYFTNITKTIVNKLSNFNMLILNIKIFNFYA